MRVTFDAQTDTVTLSQAESYEEMAEFWETHSIADYDKQTQSADITFSPAAFRNTVTIEAELMEELVGIARARRISPETLVNVWLRRFVDQLQQNRPIMQE